MQGQHGKYYAVSGGTWIEVPDDTTLEDVKELFCWGEEARKYWDMVEEEYFNIDAFQTQTFKRLAAEYASQIDA
jgi:hypothetical protein